jgi:hypothetical protein
MLDLATVTADINRWIETFVEVPHPSLDNWAPCPYARQARLNQEYEIRLGSSPGYDLVTVAQTGLGNQKVVVVVYDTADISANELEHYTDYYNRLWLIGQNLLALTDHPGDPEEVNGVAMNQGQYALLLIQSLSDLNEKAQLLGSKGFYKNWPETYARSVFAHRKDPRPI